MRPITWPRPRAAFENGEFEQALRLYSKVLEYNPQNTAAWTAQVRMLIELGEFREAKLWADKALERFPTCPELLAAKSVALARSGDLQAALAFSDASIEERGDTPYIWLARGDVMLARKEQRANYCFEKAMLLAPKDWFIALLAARIRFYYEQFVLAMNLLQQAIEWNAGRFVLWLELGPLPAGHGIARSGSIFIYPCAATQPGCREADDALIQPFTYRSPSADAFGWFQTLKEYHLNHRRARPETAPTEKFLNSVNQIRRV